MKYSNAVITASATSAVVTANEPAGALRLRPLRAPRADSDPAAHGVGGSLRSNNRATSYGHVIHTDLMGEIERAEVVAAVGLALDGGDNFEALISSEAGTKLVTLKKDGMMYNNEEVHSDGPFTVKGCFVEDEPEVNYVVTCPSAAKCAICKVIGPEGSVSSLGGSQSNILHCVIQ